MVPKYINIYYIITNIMHYRMLRTDYSSYFSQHGQADVWCISHSMIVHLSYLMCQSSHILVSDAANCIAGWLESIKNMWCGCGEVGVSVGRCL